MIIDKRPRSGLHEYEHLERAIKALYGLASLLTKREKRRGKSQRRRHRVSKKACWSHND